MEEGVRRGTGLRIRCREMGIGEDWEREWKLVGGHLWDARDLRWRRLPRVGRVTLTETPSCWGCGCWLPPVARYNFQWKEGDINLSIKPST